MPISPKNQKRYPPNWPDIRRSILQRSRWLCEFCGVADHAWIVRGEGNRYRVITYEDEEGNPEDPMRLEVATCCDNEKVVRVVLTIAHLDHQPENCDPENLRALCARCHNRYDKAHRQSNARRTRREKAGQLEMGL